MTEKNIFCLLTFFVIKYFTFYFFWLKIPTPSFPTTPLQKLRSCQAPPPFFLKIWLELQPVPQTERGGAHYDFLQAIWSVS